MEKPHFGTEFNISKIQTSESNLFADSTFDE